MSDMDRKTRRKLIVRRRIFISACCLVLAAVLGLLIYIAVSISAPKDKEPKASSEQSGIVSSEQSGSLSSEQSGTVSGDAASKALQTVKNTSDPTVDGELNPDYENLMLINADNPLPENYEEGLKLKTVDKKYRNNDNVTDIEENVYPFITEMVKKANEDGVDLKVWSPFRSYAIQNTLFQNQVARVGGDEEKAATVVARPGTSEHNTGLCADFNMADDAFENTKMYTWMKENAENYGFVLRYPKDKTEITGVIYESWHWRFVGVNRAKEMNRLGMCLEEYVEYLKGQS